MAAAQNNIEAAPTQGKRVVSIITLSHFLNHLNSTGTSFLISIFVSASLGLSAAEVGLVVAIGSLTSGLFQLAFSFLIRRYSSRALLIAGNLVMAAGGIYFGLSSSLANLLGARFVWGLGSSPQHPVGTSAISDNFEPERRGRMLGLSNGITYIGNIIGPVTASAIALIYGWRICSYLLGGMLMVSVIALFVGLNAGAKIKRTVVKAASGFKSFFEALRDRDVLLVTLSSATIGTGGIGVLTTFLPLFLVDSLGFSKETTTALITVYLFGGPIGSSFLGRLSDRWSRKYASMIAILMSGLFVFIVTLAGHNIFLIGATFFVLGLFSLSVSTVQQSYLSGISSAPIRDMAYGIYFTLSFGVGSLWTTVSGVLISAVGYNVTFVALAATTIPSALLLLMSHEFKK